MFRQNTKPTNVWIIRANNTVVKVEDAPFIHYADTGWELDLTWAKKQMGDSCSIAELVRLRGIGDLWVDEEGLFKEVPILNGMATMLYHSIVPTTNPIVGDVVLVLTPGTPMEEKFNKHLGTMVKN